MSNTKIIYFRECQGYSFLSLEEKLSIYFLSNDTGKEKKKRVNSIISRLVRARFLKVLRKPKDDIGEILDGEEVEGDYNYDDNRIVYSFVYVGIIETDGIIMYVYPKYIDCGHYEDEKADDKDKIKDAKKTVAVLRKYKNESLKYKLGNKNEEDRGSNNKLPFELFLLEDYFQNGIYTKTESVVIENGNGEIDWVETINETDAIIKKGKPYYTTLLTNETNNDSNDYITRLHEAIISDISRDLSENGLLDLFGISPAVLTPLKVEQLDSSNNKSFAIHLLERELRVQYITQKRHLLKALIDYLSIYSSKTLNSSFMYYGTTSFNLVFEKACAEVFGDVKDKKLSELIENKKIDAKDYDNKMPIFSKTLKECIDKPSWKIGGESYDAKETLEPDAIVMGKNSGDPDSNYFVILDAKYYLINCSNRNGSISGQPGVGDIIKQYAYMQSYLKHKNGLLNLLNVTNGTNAATILNAFIFPKKKSECSDKSMWCFERDDCVSMNYFDTSLGCAKDIKILKVDPDMLFNLYLKGEKETSMIKKIFEQFF